ncbi:acyltransferase family protein [Psychrilyobacter sp.]|uniref:acyltransferase family protein n=1 Tax=Psychrilyobacter sp. TaxID=2586924 RepID=UPI003C78F6BF
MIKIINSVSFLQVFGIILVVMGHIGYPNYIETFLFHWIYSFHMPLFLFISGYLFKHTYKANTTYIDFIKKKVVRLIIPYVIISSIAYVPKYILNSFAIRKVELTLKSFIHRFFYPDTNPIIFFWFLPTLFIILITFFIIQKLLNDNNFKYSLELGLLITLALNLIVKFDTKLLNINGVFHYYFFFYLGYYFYCKEKIFYKIFFLKTKNTLFLLLGITLLNTFFYTQELPILNIVISILGIFFSISLGEFYKTNNFKFLNHLYGFSFTIYLLSWFPQIFIRITFFQILKLNFYVGFIFSVVLGIYVPFVIGSFIKNKGFKQIQKLVGI